MRYQLIVISVAFIVCTASIAVSEGVQIALRGADKGMILLQATPAPTSAPSRPTFSPTLSPTHHPTYLPSTQPSGRPTSLPSNVPTAQPSCVPSGEPTGQPTQTPTLPTGQPSCMPTGPTSQPTQLPTSPTNNPSPQPTQQPSGEPTGVPTGIPTSEPSLPTLDPTAAPTTHPTFIPSAVPTPEPSSAPSFEPTTVEPTPSPTPAPSTATPTSAPSTATPTVTPTSSPTAVPSTARPTIHPTPRPTHVPTIDPTPQPTRLPTSFPTRSPTEKSIATQYAEAALEDRLVYLLIGIGVILLVMFCVCFYCCLSYGVPSLCLIYKTKVSKVYVDERGNEIDNFERRFKHQRKDADNHNRWSSAASIVSDEHLPTDARRGSNAAAHKLMERPSSAGSRRSSVDSAVGDIRQSSMVGVMVPLSAPPIAKSPLSGLPSAQPAILNSERPTERQSEYDSKPLPPSGSRQRTNSDDPIINDNVGLKGRDTESQATIQFNLQMWIQGLITANDMIRQHLGLPVQVKSTRKVYNLLIAAHPLPVAEINQLVQYAQEMTEENAALQRLLDSGGIDASNDETVGHKRKLRPKASPTRRASVNQLSQKHLAYEQSIEVENSTIDFEEADPDGNTTAKEKKRKQSCRREIEEDIDGVGSTSPSLSERKTPKGVLGRFTRQGDPAYAMEQFPNQGSSLTPEALGYREPLGSQTPGVDTTKSQERKNKTEPNFVRIAKNSGKGETLEAIAKHDKLEKREKFARNLYKQR